jgi:hypothetical protein
MQSCSQQRQTLTDGIVCSMSIHFEASLSPIALPRLPADTTTALAPCATSHTPVETVVFEEVEALIGVYIDVYC